MKNMSWCFVCLRGPPSIVMLKRFCNTAKAWPADVIPCRDPELLRMLQHWGSWSRAVFLCIAVFGEIEALQFIQPLSSVSCNGRDHSCMSLLVSKQGFTSQSSPMK